MQLYQSYNRFKLRNHFSQNKYWSVAGGAWFSLDWENGVWDEVDKKYLTWHTWALLSHVYMIFHSLLTPQDPFAYVPLEQSHNDTLKKAFDHIAVINSQHVSLFHFIPPPPAYSPNLVISIPNYYLDLITWQGRV